MLLFHFSDDSKLTLVDGFTLAAMRGGDISLHKPVGLWVSDEAEGGWLKWCWSESYPIGQYAYAVKLSEAHGILILDDEAKLSAFETEYSYTGAWGLKLINWAAVMRENDGIIISPYHGGYKGQGKPSEWYYGWDCASGCIWNIETIADMRQLSTGEFEQLCEQQGIAMNQLCFKKAHHKGDREYGMELES